MKAVTARILGRLSAAIASVANASVAKTSNRTVLRIFSYFFAVA
jgi:hypothetical protein